MKIMTPLNRFVLFLQNENDIKNLNFSLRNTVIGVIVTGVLMWSYFFNSQLVVEDHLNLKTMSFIYCVIHILSPFAYRIYPSQIFVTNLFLTPGLMFQYHHSMATGGFYSVTAIWFSVIPLLAGLITNKKNMFIWFTTVIVAFFSLIYLDHLGLTQTYPVGKFAFWNHVNMGVGYTIINVLLVWAYIDYRDKKKKVIEEQNESIRSLLRIISHDISNPLSVIKIGTNIILKKEKDLGEQDQVILKNNLEAVENIRAIIEHTRELEAIDSGKKELTLTPVSLQPILKRSVRTFLLRAEEKQIDISFEELEDEVTILADKICLENQIFNNLLSNAIKFTPKGKNISIRVHRDQNNIHVIFEDSGIGIKEELLPSLFNNSKTTSTLGTEGEMGTGFGLPIVKSILSKMDGKMSISSKHQDKFPESHGTIFTLTFKKVI